MTALLQSKARLLQLNAKLAETLTSKGVTATADETTTALVNKVGDIASGDDSVLRGLIQRDLTDLIIPDGIIKIGTYTFGFCTGLKKVIIPNSVINIQDRAFFNCSNLTVIVLSISLEYLGSEALRGTKITELILKGKVRNIQTNALPITLEKINLPKSLVWCHNNAFSGCTKLRDVTLDDNFNCNNVNLSVSTLYTRETIVSWLNALADRTGQTAYKLTIGATNLAKLTEQDILIATNKNWTLA